MFACKAESLHKKWNTVIYFARASVMKKKVVTSIPVTNTEAENLEHLYLKRFTGWSNVYE
jgi:hypothetical protein